MPVGNSGEYAQPTYPEYAPPVSGAQAFGSPPMPASQVPPAYAGPGYAPQGPPPMYIPETPQPGYVPPTPQPGYMPPMYQPGYMPPSPPPGYVPQQPGSFPPNRPPQEPQPRRRLGAGAIASIVLMLVVLIAGTTTGIVALSRLGKLSVTPVTTPNTCSGANCSTTSPTTPGQTTSAFQAAACPFKVGAGLVEGQQVSCGYITVPENRATKSDRKVKLAVAIFKAKQYMTSVDPAPVVRLDGGPGGNSLDSVAQYIDSTTYSKFILNHNVVMFDQRGTGYSTPSLKCPEIINLQYQTSSTGDLTSAAHQCYDRLVSQGIDLNGFNTLQNAADVSDVIHALGYQQMTVYGVSYGTRLALTVMRLYPQVVRASILDSTYPTNHNRNELTTDAQRVYNVLFQGCSKDANCNKKYPNLKDVFYKLVDSLNQKPISLNTSDPTTNTKYTVPFAGDDLVGFIFSTFYVTSLIPLIPQIIYQVNAHQYDQLAYLYGYLEFDSTFSDGMFYSVECGEDWPFLTTQDITASKQGIEPHIAKVFGGYEESEYEICQFWKVQQVPAEQKQPVLSNLPSLVLAGEYDPITPPALGEEAAKTLTNGYFFVFPGQGHGQEYSSTCSDSIISAFQDKPTEKPASTCIGSMTEPAFQ